MRNCLKIFRNFLGIFLEFFRGFFERNSFGKKFREDFLGEIVLEDIFGRNSLGGILTLLKSAKLFEYRRN